MDRDWRCSSCGRKLGSLHGERIHIRFSRGHEYLVGYPVTGVCRGCRTLNEVRSPDPDSTPQPSLDRR